MLPDGPSARSVKYAVFLFNRTISTRWNIDLSTCAHIFNTTWFRRSTVAMTEEIFCSRNWHAHWNVESSAGGAQWPTGFYHLWVKSWLRPMTLTLTVRGNKKLCSHFKSARVSAHTQDMLQWSEKLQDTTPSNFAITGPDCCRLLKQLPQGDQSNLVYSSLSIHSSNLAQVITTSLSSPKSSPKVLSQNTTFGSAVCLLDIDRNKHSISMPMHFLGRAYVRSPSVGDPAQPAHPEHISHTNTHLSHRSNPLHHSRGWSLSLNVPPCSERTNKSSDLPLICSLPSAWATVSPTHQGQALRRGAIH